MFTSNLILGLDATVSLATFKGPDKNYVEVCYHILGYSVEFSPVDSVTFQSSVEVLIFFRKGEKIINYDKFKLSSPVSQSPINFVDLKRYALPDGDYELELEIRDLNSEDNDFTWKQKFEIRYPDQEIVQSDIQFIGSFYPENSNHPFVKNGYFIEPQPFNYFDRNANSVTFYNEVYNASSLLKEDFVLDYSIRRYDESVEEALIRSYKRKSPKEFDVIILQMDISELGSGNYILEVSVRNRSKEMLSKKEIFFQRSNPAIDLDRIKEGTQGTEHTFVAGMEADKLRYSLKALAPRISPDRVETLNYLISHDDLDNQRFFLFDYWAKENPANPEGIYLKYMEVVKAIDKMFNSGFGYGFETDRGHIYLKYGKPDDIVTVEDDPSAPPYEIWAYNYFPSTKQTNVKFLFYNPTLSTNDYSLLHSNARGERNNSQWQLTLYKNAPNDIQGGNYIDGTEMQDNFNRRASEYLSDF